MKANIANGLKKATVTPGNFSPSEDFKGYESLVIFADEVPVLALGPAGDIGTEKEGEALLSSSEFQSCVSPLLPEVGLREDATLSLRVVGNGELAKEGEGYPCVVRKEAGEVVDEDGVDGEMVWFSPISGEFRRVAEAFTVALCLSKEISEIADFSLQ